MGQSSTRGRLSLLIAFAAGAAAASLGAVLFSFFVVSGGDDTVVQSNRILYLVPQDIDAAKLPASFEELEDLGITPVHTWLDLVSSTDRATVAILVDRDSLPEVRKAWLVDRFREGKVIGGIRISGAELGSQLPVDPDLALTQMGWFVQGRVFYVLVVGGTYEGGKGRCSGAGSDYLDRGMEKGFQGLKRMIAGIERKSECGRGVVPSAPSGLDASLANR